MKPIFPLAVGAVALFGLGVGVAPGHAAAPADFSLGQNAEKQACRAAARYGQNEPGRSFDIFCGEWERPSGKLTVLAAAQADRALAQLQTQCPGEAKALASGGFEELRQIACTSATPGVARFGLYARRGGQVFYGVTYPADWAPLVLAAEVAGGAVRASAAPVPAGQSPGLAEIAAVYPDGAPGQAAEANYELLRRRAYEKNVLWSFGGAGQDFQDLLAAHGRISPTDIRGEADIEAEIALNLSDARRFEEATDMLDRAEAGATTSGNRLLQSKVLNYRAAHLMNQRRYALALAMAGRANAARAALAREQADAGGAFRISAADARTISQRTADRGARTALVSGEGMSEADRTAILSAQGWYLQGAAARALGLPEARADLERAANFLANTPVPPPWLTALVRGEQARVRLASGNVGAAESVIGQGLVSLRSMAPGSRAEGHLLMTLATVQNRAGRPADALASGRAAMAIFAAQRESPGLPAELASDYLAALHDAWSTSKDPKLAAEYFEAMALVWDGAAARSASQLAARLASGEAGDEARDYQDAQRAHRAALARRQRLGADPDTPAQASAEADRKVREAAAALETAEAKLRARSPRYLELLSPAVTAQDMRQALAPQEGYVRFALANSGGFGVLATHDAITPFRIAIGDAAADKLTRRVRATSAYAGRRLPDYDIDAAAQLYAALLGPVASELTSLKRLEVDAPGALAALPFPALVTAKPSPEDLERIRGDQDYTGVQWLARQVAVSSAVGPASFVRIRRVQAPASGLSAAAFANFSPAPRLVAQRIASERGLSDRCEADMERALMRLSALPSTAEEAADTARMFGPTTRVRTGAGFTDSDFLDAPEVGSAGVIMLATHGVLGLSNCFPEPALLASLGRKGDGLIEASELLDRKLSAQIVVLSACDTAGGGRANVERTGLSDGGEALSGLARGFLYAGARSVLATQWQVDATSSAEEVDRFFTSAMSDGLPLAEALNRSQKQLFETPETAHPFYWAGFVLIGDGGATLASPKAGAVHAAS